MRWQRLLILLFSNWTVLLLTIISLLSFNAWRNHFVVERSNLLDLAETAFMVVLLTFIGALALAIIQYLVLFKGEKQTLGKMRALVNHHWQDVILDDPIEGLYASRELKTSIEELRNQLQALVLVAQKQHAAEMKIDGETRSEIVKQERQRIARELHDSVSQQLFAMTMLLSALQESTEEMPVQARRQLQQIADMVHSAQAEMRALLLHLRPVTLKDHTLAEGIRRLVAELDTKVQTNFETRLEEVTLPKEIEDHLFRIVQELLSNALRHAHCTLIECELFEQQNTAVLRFIDNGVGFDVSAGFHSSGYGLNNIKERVSQMGGFFKIISIPAQGTVIEISIPIETATEREAEQSSNGSNECKEEVQHD